MQVECPSCKKVVDAPDAQAGRIVNCPACGREMQVPAPAAPAAGVAPAPSAGAKKCPHCGESIQAEAVKCRHCGEWLDPAKRAALEEAAKLLPKYQKGMKGLGWGVIIFAGLNLAFLVPSSLFEAMSSFQEIFIIIFAIGMIALIAASGVLLLRRLAWANYAVAIVFGILLLLVLIAAATGTFFSVWGVLIPIVAIVNAVNNLKSLAKLQNAGLDPWQKVEKK